MPQVFKLFWSDYLAHRAPHGFQPAWRLRLLFPLRLFINPSLRAVLAFRLGNASPRALWWVWRNYFVHCHAIDWAGPLIVGPGFQFPHPVGIVMVPGSRIGSDCGLGQHVTLAGDVGDGRPVLGDRVSVYPGAVIMGGVTVGEDSIVGANSVVIRDVPPNMLVTPRGVIPREASERHTTAAD